MNWDTWTLLVLALAVLSSLRPVWATLRHRRVPPTQWRGQSLERAGGGMAMLTVAVYLVVEARRVIGRGFWDMAVLAVDSPFMRSLPAVWIPALCWVALVLLGLWFLFRGAMASHGPRDPMAAVWAMNEVAVFAVLLWWNIYVPETWPEATLINFGLQGFYCGCIAGSLMRFVLVMRPSGRTSHPHDPTLHSKPRHWAGRYRRY